MLAAQRDIIRANLQGMNRAKVHDSGGRCKRLCVSRTLIFPFVLGSRFGFAESSVLCALVWRSHLILSLLDLPKLLRLSLRVAFVLKLASNRPTKPGI